MTSKIVHRFSKGQHIRVTGGEPASLKLINTDDDREGSTDVRVDAGTSAVLSKSFWQPIGGLEPILCQKIMMISKHLLSFQSLISEVFHSCHDCGAWQQLFTAPTVNYGYIIYMCKKKMF